MRYWWPTILTGVKNVSINCDVCQHSKIISKQNRLTLNPWPVLTRPWELVSMDHKKLSRKTTLENTHILVFCDHFSGKVIYCPVPSETAFVTAQAFVRETVAQKGTPLILVSDRASGFMSIFFRTVTKLLGVRHCFTAAHSKQSNGRTENAIKQLNAELRLYSRPEVDDLSLESILPIIELGVRASANQDTKMSPFAICYGYEMRIPVASDVDVPSFCSSEAEDYAKRLKARIDMLHQAVRINRVENKESIRQTYDK